MPPLHVETLCGSSVFTLSATPSRISSLPPTPNVSLMDVTATWQPYARTGRIRGAELRPGRRMANLWSERSWL